MFLEECPTGGTVIQRVWFLDPSLSLDLNIRPNTLRPRSAAVVGVLFGRLQQIWPDRLKQQEPLEFN